ncbi:MAG: LacI family DNA-binding transcriptional regulator [Beutenbergiaceae bacterium]
MVKRAGRRRRRTLQDVADAVGLSVNTVSRALNDMPGVGAATRARIKHEADRIGYVPNAHARSLVLGSRKTIGVVVTDLANPFFSDLVSEIEARATAAGYTLLLLLSYEDPLREQAAVDAALRAGVDGIIGVAVSDRGNPWESVVKAHVPLVLVAREVPGVTADFYSADNEAGRRRSADLVVEGGARDILILEEGFLTSTVQHRIDGIRASLLSHDIEFDSGRVELVPSRMSRSATMWRGDDAYRIINDLLDRGRLPDAVLAGNDYFALGVYTAFRERGVRIPDDVAVVGWGDYPFARFLDPPLTSVHLPAVEVAARATTRLLALIDGASEPPVSHYVAPELVFRRSTLSPAPRSR